MEATAKEYYYGLILGLHNFWLVIKSYMEESQDQAILNKGKSKSKRYN